MLLLFRIKPNNICKHDIRSLPRPADTDANQISSWHVLRTSAHLTASAEVGCYCSSLDLWTLTLHVPFSAINTIQKETVRHKLRTNHLLRVHLKTNTKPSRHAAPTTWLKRLSLTRGRSRGVLCVHTGSRSQKTEISRGNRASPRPARLLIFLRRKPKSGSARSRKPSQPMWRGA